MSGTGGSGDAGGSSGSSSSSSSSSSSRRRRRVAVGCNTDVDCDVAAQTSLEELEQQLNEQPGACARSACTPFTRARMHAIHARSTCARGAPAAATECSVSLRLGGASLPPTVNIKPKLAPLITPSSLATSTYPPRRRAHAAAPTQCQTQGLRSAAATHSPQRQTAVAAAAAVRRRRRGRGETSASCGTLEESRRSFRRSCGISSAPSTASRRPGSRRPRWRTSRAPCSSR